MKVMPSIDLSNGKAVKRVKGVRGSGIVVGDPITIANKLYDAGYEDIHIVDLDAAEGLGENEDAIKNICRIGFKWIQIGGGVRSAQKASKILSYGASAVVISTMFFVNRKEFEKTLSIIGKDKIIIALDYDAQYNVLIKGWKEKAIDIYTALQEVKSYDVKGVLLTYVESEGTEKGIDKNVGTLVKHIHRLKEYAGGVTSINDLLTLKSYGFDYAIIGMSLYKGRLWGIRVV